MTEPPLALVLFFVGPLEHTGDYSTIGNASGSIGARLVGLFTTTGQRLGIAGELFSFFWSNKRWWMTPILVTLGVFAVLLILAQASAIAPFIYTFF